MSPQPSALSPQQPATQPQAPLGPKVPQVLPRSTSELKVRRIWVNRKTPYIAPATRSLFGARSGKVAPKRVLGAKVQSCTKITFERPNAFWSLKTIDFTSENIRAGALGSSWGAKW